MGAIHPIYKVIIAGGRDFDNLVLLVNRCKGILKGKLDAGFDIEIVSGAQRTWLEEEKRFIGADYMGELFAIGAGYALTTFPADWDKFGKSAGIIRNGQMADYGDALIAAWDGKSNGTGNMIEQMVKRNKPHRIIEY